MGTTWYRRVLPPVRMARVRWGTENLRPMLGGEPFAAIRVRDEAWDEALRRAVNDGVWAGVKVVVNRVAREKSEVEWVYWVSRLRSVPEVWAWMKEWVKARRVP